ncbi:unnamed protein product [Symbiodinium necroappetens]|uniref:C2 domain-containing protein n=1 Tax=Symbiodinium necroappetens TaxID=1628268 RepID=A0A813BFL9_9DINO|nr:unnamed protein product [Symbiodinium necroappetens]
MLAVCHMDLSDLDLAVAHSQQAVAEAPNSEERRLALQVQLTALVQRRSRGALGHQGLYDGQSKECDLFESRFASPVTRESKFGNVSLTQPDQWRAQLQTISKQTPPMVQEPGRVDASASDSEFQTLANDVFASNPRVAEEEKKRRWGAEKGFTSLLDPSLDPRQKVLANELPREDFHFNRWRCIFHPDRAVETLGPVAHLELSILSARDLVGEELSLTLQPSCNPYAKVYLDDRLACRTKCQQRTTTPDWRFHRSLDVVCPYSMLRIQVADQTHSNVMMMRALLRDAQMGFVEICLGDVPFNRDIEGWFELRYKAQTAEPLKDAEPADTKLQMRLAQCSVHAAEELVNRRYVLDMDRMPERIFEASRPEDAMFAMALCPPASEDHGTHLQVDGDPNFHLQGLWDDVADVKRDLVEDVAPDAMSCVSNFILYILLWRSFLVTGTLVAWLVLPLAYSALRPHQRNLWLLSAVVPGMLAFIMLLLSGTKIHLSCPKLRASMVHGGVNAPLTQEGFASAAAWRDSAQMVAFLRRVIADLQGIVNDDHELQSLAARCFRDGKPRLTLSELRTVLKGAHWVSIAVSEPEDAEKASGQQALLREGFPGTRLSPGDLVLVDNHARAIVKSIEDPFVVVEYDDPEHVDLISREQASEQSTSTSQSYETLVPLGADAEAVVSDRGALAKSFSAQDAVLLKCAFVWEKAVEDRETSQSKVVTPAAGSGATKAENNFDQSFKTGPVARLALLLVFGMLSSVSIAAFVLELTQESAGRALARMLLRYFILGSKILLLAVISAVFLSKARWFVPVRSFCRIFLRTLCHKRRAPDIWPFFREGAAQSDASNDEVCDAATKLVDERREFVPHASLGCATRRNRSEETAMMVTRLAVLLGAAQLCGVGGVERADALTPSEAAVPISEDDECSDGSEAETCALSALQRAGMRKEYQDELLQSEEASGDASIISWKGARETGSSCFWTNCDEVSLGPTECHHFRCICRENYYYNKEADKCTPVPDNVEGHDTGGRCHFFSCAASRGLTQCVAGKCLCIAGYTAENGVCKAQEGFSELPGGDVCGTPKMDDLCWKAVDWAMHDNIYANPKQYAGLHAGASSFQEFQQFVHEVDKVTCPKPCPVNYEHFDTPKVLDPAYQTMKGVSYGPAPVKKAGSPINGDDYMADITGAMWADWGRGDLELIKQLGGNTIRMYGNDANTSHRAFLDLAYEKGIDVVAGMSDFGFTQGPDNCLINDWYCFDEAYFYFHKNLLMGFAIDSFKRYHPALKALILANEPDLKVHPRSLTCRAMASVFDAILEAEKDVGVTGNPIALTITWSFALFPDANVHPNAPALGQMEEFWACLQKGTEKEPINYTPRNDLVQAFRKRFVHSFNTANKAREVANMMLNKYSQSSFWTPTLKVPVFIGEYHSVHGNMEEDLTEAVQLAKSPRYPYFMGYSFFEFSRSYWKGGPEMEFGMFGYGDCPLMDMNYTGNTYTIWNLIPLKDRRGNSLPSALRKAFAQDSSLPKILAHEHIQCKGSTAGEKPHFSRKLLRLEHDTASWSRKKPVGITQKHEVPVAFPVYAVTRCREPIASPCHQRVAASQKRDHKKGRARMSVPLDPASSTLDVEIRKLWGLLATLWRNGHLDAAKDILKAAMFLSAHPEAPEEVAKCWLGVGRCCHRAGLNKEAAAFAQKALADARVEVAARLLLLEVSCEKLKAEESHKARPEEAWLQLEMMRKHTPGLSLEEAARAAKLVLEQPSEDLATAGLEFFVACAVREESQEDPNGLIISVQLLIRALELKRSDTELLQRLDAVAAVSARVSLHAELRNCAPATPGLAALREAVSLAWSRGQELGDSCQWELAASMFERIHRILQPLDTLTPHGPDLDVARLQELWSARAWCLVLEASARIQQAKDLKTNAQDRSMHLQQARCNLDTAHRLRRQSEKVSAESLDKTELRSSPWSHRLFMILVLVEFEVKCLTGETEVSLQQFVDQASSHEAVGLHSLLAMAKILAASSYRRLAIHCLQSYLRVLTATRAAVDYKQIVAAYRNMIALLSSRNDGFRLFEGLCKILSQASQADELASSVSLEEEAAWLIAKSWNTGRHFYRLQQYRYAEHWMSNSLSFAKIFPGKTNVGGVRSAGVPVGMEVEDDEDLAAAIEWDQKSKRSANNELGQKGEASVGEWLKSGVVLCNLVNAIQPGLIRTVNQQSVPFKQMVALVQYALGGAVQTVCPDFTGPKLGIPLIAKGKDVKVKGKTSSHLLHLDPDQVASMREELELVEENQLLRKKAEVDIPHWASQVRLMAQEVEEAL